MEELKSDWAIDEPADIEELQSVLFRRARQKSLYRGTPRRWMNLKPGLARFLDTLPASQRSNAKDSIVEKKSLEIFQTKIELFPDPDPARANALRSRLGKVQYMQHVGIPTRLLDWTSSAWVAAFFASDSQMDHSGVLWWVDQGQLHECVDSAWAKWGITRDSSGSVSPEHLISSGSGIDWFCPVYNVFPFRRMQLQQGAFTMAGGPGIDHAELLTELVPRDSRGVIIIRAKLKHDLLSLLHGMNIFHATLGLAPDDGVGRSVSATMR